MYCTSDVWQLRARRRRSKFYGSVVRHTDAIVQATSVEGKTGDVPFGALDDDVDSGSDDEDWVVAEPEEVAASADEQKDPDSAADEPENAFRGVLPWKGGDGMRGARPEPVSVPPGTPAETAALLAELQAELWHLKKDLVRSREQHAMEVARRQKCELERDEAKLRVAELSSALVDQHATSAAEKAAITSQVHYEQCFAALAFAIGILLRFFV